MRWHSAFLMALMVQFFAFIAQPAHALDLVALGKAEAIEHCVRCHPALRSGRPSRAEARTFRSLTKATSDAEAEAALNTLLGHGHAGLSGETFSHAELGALAVYLRNLKW